MAVIDIDILHSGQTRDGRYPKNSFGRLVGRLVEPLFVVQETAYIMRPWTLRAKMQLYAATSNTKLLTKII